MKILVWIAGIILFFATIFGLQYFDLLSFSFFAPKYAKVQRNVFENTPSYVQGKIQDLSNYKLQYDQDTSLANKQAIKSVIQLQFSNFDIDQCPDGLMSFLQETRGY